MPENKIAYMIRRKSDGLYSSGGTVPQFKKNGKIWSSIGALKNHLNQGISIEYGDWKSPYPDHKIIMLDIFVQYIDCEIVELKSVVTENSSDLNMKKLFSNIIDRMQKENKDKRIDVGNWYNE